MFDCGLLDIAGMDRNLVVCSNQINLGEEATVVMDVTDRIAVWNGTSVERSVVSAGMPTVVLLRRDVKCGGPRIFGAASCAISQHGVESRFGNGEPVRC
jgi:hypothetical protein